MGQQRFCHDRLITYTTNHKGHVPKLVYGNLYRIDPHDWEKKQGFSPGTTKRPCHDRPITSSCSTAAHIIYPLTIMYVETEQSAVYAGCFSQENLHKDINKNTMFPTTEVWKLWHVSSSGMIQTIAQETFGAVWLMASYHPELVFGCPASETINCKKMHVITVIIQLIQEIVNHE